MNVELSSTFITIAAIVALAALAGLALFVALAMENKSKTATRLQKNSEELFARRFQG